MSNPQENLMTTFKRSLARDFKINIQTMDTVLNEEEEGEGEIDGVESGEGSEGEGAELDSHPPLAKRQRQL